MAFIASEFICLMMYALHQKGICCYFLQFLTSFTAYLKSANVEYALLLSFGAASLSSTMRGAFMRMKLLPVSQYGPLVSRTHSEVRALTAAPVSFAALVSVSALSLICPRTIVLSFPRVPQSSPFYECVTMFWWTLLATVLLFMVLFFGEE